MRDVICVLGEPEGVPLEECPIRNGIEAQTAQPARAGQDGALAALAAGSLTAKRIGQGMPSGAQARPAAQRRKR